MLQLGLRWGGKTQLAKEVGDVPFCVGAGRSRKSTCTGHAQPGRIDEIDMRRMCALLYIHRLLVCYTGPCILGVDGGKSCDTSIRELDRRKMDLLNTS